MFNLESQWFWYTAGILFLIFEMIIPGTFLPGIFFFSAIVTGISANFVSDPIILGLIFALLSIILIVFAKPILEKKFRVNEEVRPSALDAMTGKKGVVILEVKESEKGRATFDNESWLIISEDNNPIPVDTRVEIVRIEGATAVVKTV